MAETMTVFGAVLQRHEDVGSAQVWAANADAGAFTITATYDEQRIRVQRWHVQLYVHRAQASGRVSAHLVASAFGATREDAERGLTVEMASLIRVAAVKGAA